MESHKPQQDIEHTLTAIIEQAIYQFENRTLSPDGIRTVLENVERLAAGYITPMSGMSIQQTIRVQEQYIKKLNTLTGKHQSVEDMKRPFYVYMFAREATSAGVVPVYRDKKTADLYMVLICNKRDLNTYNWSAGYTEAPLPRWNGKLLSRLDKDSYFNREAIIKSARNTMEKLLAEAGGDWNKVNYNHKRFEEGFISDEVDLPNVDLNSLHTAFRECIEEIQLDCNQFPQKKEFLISYDNTVGISQGDAPGQLSNRSHQYMIYLGELDQQPEIKPGDDVAIADWVKVSDIVRKSPTEYVVNGKPLCIYMLRALEKGLHDLWDNLVSQTSTYVSRNNQSLTRFSTVENVMAEIDRLCASLNIEIKNTVIGNFLQSLTDDSLKTRMGEEAHAFLTNLLKVTEYLMKPSLAPKQFVADIEEIFSSKQPPSSAFRDIQSWGSQFPSVENSQTTITEQKNYYGNTL